MKKILSIIFLFLLAVFIVKAQNPEEVKNKAADSTIKTKEISIQLTPFGYIILPKDYWAYMDADYMDAWGGVIEPIKGDFKIIFSDGIMVSVFDGEDKNLKWKKQLVTDNGIIYYALAETKKSKRILAKIWTANFSAKIKDDSDVERFLEIIKRYRRGKCESCFNSKYTKQLKKIFERQIEND
jgi:hypothetical protein